MKFGIVIDASEKNDVKFDSKHFLIILVSYIIRDHYFHSYIRFRYNISIYYSEGFSNQILPDHLCDSSIKNVYFQIILVTRRKNDLEKRIDDLLGEREGLSSTLDDTSDKILMLERHAREQESQV